MTPLEMQLGPVLRKVFTIYAVFWVVVIVALYFAIGALIARAERQKKH